MDFFKLEQPAPEQSAQEEPERDVPPAETGVPPRARQPLFKQDPLPGLEMGGHVSLSAYISRHLESSGRQEPSVQEPAGSGPAFVPMPDNPPREYKPEGQFLNTLDVEMTSGLEQYMPTPVFRLRVVKKRLDAEIADLKRRINKMERLPDQPVELRENIEVIRRRIAVLETHERKVSRQLAALLAMGPVFCGIFERYETSRTALGTWLTTLQASLASWLFGPARQQLVQLGSELTMLTEVLDDRFRDTAVTQAEISHLINRYEATLRQMEAASRRLQSETFWQRLWKPLRGLVK